jgi:hypothetical protein
MSDKIGIDVRAAEPQETHRQTAVPPRLLDSFLDGLFLADANIYRCHNILSKGG